mgnify:CR=1 FL=1
MRPAQPCHANISLDRPGPAWDKGRMNAIRIVPKGWPNPAAIKRIRAALAKPVRRPDQRFDYQATDTERPRHVEFVAPEAAKARKSATILIPR